ncbi:MAG TPA: ABC transporter permease [Verrucomicrobiae bacterium]|jgi:predicted permease|nr:ABC transporter permease [Verrucomicrobiae bacterium]
MRRRKRMLEELDRDIHEHIARETQDNIDRGMSPEEARYAAMRKFGNVMQVKEEARNVWSLIWLEQLFEDIRFGLRLLRKNLGFTAVAILTLALGIGANAAVFSVVYAVLLRPLAYKDPSRLVVLHETTPKVGDVSVSFQNFIDWRAASRTFAQMAIVQSVDFNLAGVTQPENINGDAVSPNFLSMMGVRPFLGRDFDASEEKAGTAPVLLLSYSLWQSHLGGDPNAVGKTITLDGRSFTIVGVLPPNYRSLDTTDVMLPIGVWATDNAETIKERGDRGDTVVIGRLAMGVAFEQARAEMEGIAARLATEYPASNDQFSVALQPIRQAFVGDMKTAILVLFGAVLFVLLIACANVANLFLVRGASRTKEIALRIAFGASRGRIIRQMLTESFILACFGGVVGVALALGGIRGMSQLIPADMLSGASVNLNSAVLLFVAGVVALAAFIFGLAPALHSTKPDVQSELKEGGRTSSGGVAQNRLRGALAVAEISLALILLIGAGLMMKSLYRLLEVDPGFRPDRVLTMGMDLRAQQYSKDPAVLNFWQQVIDRVSALPGVESAAVGTVIPLTDSHSRSDVTVEGMALPTPGNYPHPDVHIVSPGYIRTLGIPLLRGRTFTDQDGENAPLAGMINAMVARRFFPNEDPIGKRFMFGHPSAANPPKWYTIVGVVSDTKLYGLANPARLEVYIPFRQNPKNYMALVVRSGADPASLTSAVREAVQSIDKDQPVFAISTMEKLLSNSVATRRMTLVLLGLFSGLALVLGAIGIYGVISYSVAQRTHEIGIRMALGAPRGDVFRLVVGEGLKLAGVGIAIGIAAALGLARLMSSLLYGISATDFETFTGVAVLLALVALLACYVPARRAMRVDPTVALRYE